MLAVVVLLLLFRLVEDIGPESGPDDRFTVVRVLDGDTMELAGGDRLRLLGIDTPEQGEPFYDSATDLIARIAFQHQGRIEYANSRRDKYGRLLGYLYFDTVFVNRVVIDSGYGYVYLFSDNELHSEPVRELIEAQRSAIARRVGLWSLAYEPEARYLNKVGSFRLHRPGCRSVSNLKPGEYRVFSTREEGLATGLSPCRNCKP
jgi:micrococcal nuclease